MSLEIAITHGLFFAENQRAQALTMLEQNGFVFGARLINLGNQFIGPLKTR
jgi:hypothetical protein